MISSEPVPANYRRSLLRSDEVAADELIACHALPPSGAIGGLKLVVTFAGAFEFQVGQRRTWVDSGRLLFAYDGEDYVDHHVLDGIGHACVILSPNDDVLRELGGGSNSGRSRRGSLSTLLLAQRLRRTRDALEAHETALALIARCIDSQRRDQAVDQRCVRRAKAALQECADGRISLDHLAADVGVSPAHLSQSFKRAEGVPLYRYQTELRLARALERLPGCNDITGLALDLGFSSHSHFSAAFRSKVGMTPSDYRQLSSR